MPIELTPVVTPRGRRIVRSHSTGLISRADAQHLLQQCGPGGPYQGLPLLGLMDRDAYFSVESRQAFASAGTSVATVALVVTSAPMRVTLSFITRAANAVSSSPSNVHFFATEGAALAWLDEEMGRLAGEARG